MKNRVIKVIKRNESVPVRPPATKSFKITPKKKPTVADTIKTWIDERRENNDAEDRSRRKQFTAWTPDEVIHATAS